VVARQTFDFGQGDRERAAPVVGTMSKGHDKQPTRPQEPGEFPECPASIAWWHVLPDRTQADNVGGHTSA
jgi:hypothetical protein